MVFFRSVAGVDIVLVLELPGNKESWAIEVKLGLSPQVKKGFYNACANIQLTQHFIVYSGTQRYSLPNNIEAISLHEIIELLKSLSN